MSESVYDETLKKGKRSVWHNRLGGLSGTAIKLGKSHCERSEAGVRTLKVKWCALCFVASAPRNDVLI
ncbi:hypothetical protein BH10PSE19_BH10PSE19_08630 [soil metagenome]